MKYNKNNPLRCFIAFAGYDSQCMALDRLGVDYDVVGWSEIDKNAIIAHNAIYPQYKDRNYGDITKIVWEKVPDFDLFTYSSPCQDFSNAGKQKGGEEGSGTRSSLLWECRKAIVEKRPKYCLMENVAALVSTRFIKLFNKWQLELESYGYKNYAKILNAKDYGVPQNRERIFLVSIRGNEKYYFPAPFNLKYRLKDVLEENIPEKYFLSDKMVECFIYRDNVAIEKENVFKFPKDYGNKRLQNLLNSGKVTNEDISILDTYNQSIHRDVSPTITTRINASNTIYVSEPNRKIMDKTICINSKINGKQPSLQNRIYDVDGIATAITTSYHPNIAEPLKIKQATKQGYIECESMKPDKLLQVGNLKGNYSSNRVYSAQGISPTITTMQGGNREPKIIETNIKVAFKGKVFDNGDGLYIGTSKAFMAKGLKGISHTLKASLHDAGVVSNYRIRKLTPRECFRLMGVSEENIDKIQNAGISISQQYKLAGNSIVVDTLYHIFRKMFAEKENENYQLTLF